MGGSHRLYRTANTAVMKAGHHAYTSRRQLKREMRALWIIRINAAARMHNLSYSKLMHKLSSAGVTLDRKVIAEMAVNNPKAFAELVLN